MFNGFRVTNRLLLSTVLLAAPLAAQPRIPNGDAVKIAVIVQLIQFVAWPPSSMPPDNGPLDLCVFGKDQWIPLLQEAAYGQLANGRPIKIQRIGKVPEALICHIVVVGGAVELDGVDALAKLPILTIRGDDGGRLEGAMVNITIESGRARFRLDQQRAEKAHIRFSSKLLQLAGAPMRGSR